MSYQLSFKASKCTLGSSSAKSVLRCLCDYADDDGTNCRPSTDTISLETEFDRRTVFKAIAFLSSNDWIRVYKNGRGSRNFYALNVQKISNGFEQSRILKEGFYNESSSNFVTSDKNDTSIKNATRSSIKNDTTSSYINDTSNKFDTSDKNDTEAGTFLHFHSDKNDTQLSQYSVNTQSNTFLREDKNFSLTSPEKTTISKKETVEKKPKRPKKEKVPCPYNEDDPIPEEFLKIAQKHNIQDPQQLFSKMVAYCKANGKQYADYKAAFTTWCLNESKWQQHKPANQQASKPYAYEPPGGFTEEYYREQCKFDKDGNLIL